MSSVELTVSDLHFQDLGKVFLNGVTFTVPAGKVYGLVGQNGSGKTTLLSLIAGIIQPDVGEIKLPLGTKIGFLQQDFCVPQGATILDIVLGKGTNSSPFGEYPAQQGEGFHSTDNQKAVQSQKHPIASRHPSGGELDAQDDKLSHHDWEMLEKIENLLQKFDLPSSSHFASQLSGGQQRRVFLVKTLLADPDVLLLDEPTNHLDLDTIQYLTSMLAESRATTIVISHDRRFLDEVCDGMLEVWNKQVFAHHGNYSTYLENRAARLANQAVADERTEQFLRRELEWVRAGVQARSTKNKGRLNRYYHVAAGEKSPQLKTAQIQIPPAPHLGNKIVEFRGVSVFVEESSSQNSPLGECPRSGGRVLVSDETNKDSLSKISQHLVSPLTREMSNLPHSGVPGHTRLPLAELGGGEPAGRESDDSGKILKQIQDDNGHVRLLQNFSVRFEEGMKIGVIGPNGSGKTSLFSTLLSEALRQRPESVESLTQDSHHVRAVESHLRHTGTVRVGLNTRFNIVDQKRERLDGSQTLLQFIAEGNETLPFGSKRISARAYLKSFLFRSDQMERHLSDFSGGEKARALLAKEFIRGGNFLLLDEPTNDLDLDSIRSLESALEDFDGCACIISHDREFLNHTVTHILSFDGDGKWTLSTGNYDRWLAEYGTATQAPIEVDLQKYKPQKSNWQIEKERKKRFRKLTMEIDQLQAEISGLTAEVSDPDFFPKNGMHKTQKIYSKIQTLTQKLSTAETEWLELSELVGEG